MVIIDLKMIVYVRLIVPAESGPEDFKIKPLKKKFSRKSFSSFPGSWEIDHLEYTHGNNTYLLWINTNTRYLYAYPVHSKSLAETINNIYNLIIDEKTRFNHKVKLSMVMVIEVSIHYLNIFIGYNFTFHPHHLRITIN